MVPIGIVHVLEKRNVILFMDRSRPIPKTRYQTVI